MKINIDYFLVIGSLLLLFTNACKKQEIFNTETAQVINLTIEGSTTTNLEIVFKDSVVAIAPANGSSFARDVLLNVAGLEKPQLLIREEGSSEIIASKPLDASSFKQSMYIYYDAGAIYNGKVDYTIKGYAMSSELEFLLDGNSLFTASSAINQTVSILVNEGETRHLEVRKLGETNILIATEIKPDIEEQSLGFFFDGTEIVDGIEVEPPSNPENMAIAAQFKTTFTNPNSVDLYYTGGNEIDLVFYARKKGTENTNRTTPENKVNPEIRISMPTDGTFVNFELPLLADETMEYSFDICVKGSDEIPYIKGTNASATYPEIRANQGRYGNGITIEKGESKLLLISDAAKGVLSPQPRHRIPIARITDLSEYFQ